MYSPNGRAKETIETKSTTTTKEGGGGREGERQTDRHRERERDRGEGGRVIKLSMKFVHTGCVIHAAFVTNLAWRCVTKSNQGSQVVGVRSSSTS